MEREQPAADWEFPAVDSGELADPAGPGEPGGLVPRRPVRTSRWAVRLLALLAVLAVVTAVVTVVEPPVRWPWEGRTAPGGGAVATMPAASDAATAEHAPASSAPVPSAPTDRPTAAGATTRLGSAPLPPPGGGPHAFAAFQENGITPVAYDPCRQVHYVIRPDQAPPGGEAMVQAAVSRLAETTGLQFVYDGVTDEVPSPDRAAFQPDRYGDRWAPALIAWQTEAENPSLAGDVVGQGGSIAVSLGGGPRVYVSGSVVLDSGQFPTILRRRNGPSIAQGIVLHEFGHLAGLDHVDDEDQLMHPETVAGVVDYADGDLEGLARLGRGPCVPEL